MVEDTAEINNPREGATHLFTHFSITVLFQTPDKSSVVLLPPFYRKRQNMNDKCSNPDCDGTVYPIPNRQCNKCFRVYEPRLPPPVEDKPKVTEGEWVIANEKVKHELTTTAGSTRGHGYLIRLKGVGHPLDDIAVVYRKTDARLCAASKKWYERTKKAEAKITYQNIAQEEHRYYLDMLELLKEVEE